MVAHGVPDSESCPDRDEPVCKREPFPTTVRVTNVDLAVNCQLPVKFGEAGTLLPPPPPHPKRNISKMANADLLSLLHVLSILLPFDLSTIEMRFLLPSKPARKTRAGWRRTLFCGVCDLPQGLAKWWLHHEPPSRTDTRRAAGRGYASPVTDDRPWSC